MTKSVSHSSPKVIAITGQIASGKSSVLKLFSEASWKTLSADDLVHEIYRKQDWQVAELRKRALKSPKALRELETFIHPKVRRALFAFLKENKDQWVAVEIPLLFEGGLEKHFDESIFVFSAKQQRKKRALQRGMSAALFERLEALQWSAEKKARVADLVLHNAGGPKQLKKSTEALMAWLKKKEPVFLSQRPAR